MTTRTAETSPLSYARDAPGSGHGAGWVERIHKEPISDCEKVILYFSFFPVNFSQGL